MGVDVEVETVIERSVEQVSSYAGDPGNAPDWYVNIRSVQWLTAPPLAVGSRLAFVAAFLGRRLEYVYEVVDLSPGERLVMRTDEGPFPMQTTYTWSALGTTATRMRLRNTGEAAGFSRLAAPVVARAMRRAMRHDLARLKERLEG